MSTTIFLDMDGVIADFFGSVCRMYNRDYAESHATLVPGDWMLGGFLGPLTQADMWVEINKLHEHFWEHMPEYAHSQHLYKQLKNYAPVKFLSDPGPHAHVWSGKMKWLHRFAPGVTSSDVVFTKAKSLLAGPRRLLVDDHDDNCKNFVAAGGHAILFPRKWNRRHQEEHQAVELALKEAEDWFCRHGRPFEHE
jgi:5'(3')-deoxyribonucleotidase